MLCWLKGFVCAGMPGYCGDRYHKAMAGADKVCEKFMFKK